MIDLLQLGRERVIAAHTVEDVIIDPGPSSCLPRLLDGLGGTAPRALLLTHIHLDHAGAAGTLVQRWPHLEVYVHERGARHMHDPSRLMASATRLYGEYMDTLWGEMLPVPEANLRVLHGGETVLDRFEVAYTPGHASHHVSFRDTVDGTAYVGDVGGVQIAPGLPVVPPTPPPDIDIPLWHASIETVRQWQPTRLAMTHFGFAEGDIAAHLAELDERLDRWTELARSGDQEHFVEGVRAELAAAAGPEYAESYAVAAPWNQLFSGLERFVKGQEAR